MADQSIEVESVESVLLSMAEDLGYDWLGERIESLCKEEEGVIVACRYFRRVINKQAHGEGSSHAHAAQLRMLDELILESAAVPHEIAA